MIQSTGAQELDEMKKEELDEKDKRLIRYLIRHRHTSTLEHNLITFKFCVPLFVRSQHHRHRTWSYNEISRRYTAVNIKFYEPEEFRTNQFGTEEYYSINVFFHERDLLDRNIEVRTGDYFSYGDTFFEIVTLSEPKQLYGQIDHLLEISAKCVRAREDLFSAI